MFQENGRNGDGFGVSDEGKIGGEAFWIREREICSSCES